MIRLIKSLLIAPIRIYQFLLSPWLGHWCRFTPSCSNYAIEAIQTCGPLLGVYYATRRVLRCHPWCKGGHDPVPCGSSITKPHNHLPINSQPRNHSD
ncbi:membrane protein insertion efficiency factor YidD [Zwartia sp.]|uniref:membrane protein insertion efficiency factor YidD n=1 Tax=Zwartia sp. TaxID=2978004 RepID=UPI0027215AA6|nr:membrane protein insertion efficiency factor YidD [Zwartia sp.]MDO9023711.1 membrane protein insertion efficiency factor YidD [Zwartia sp.]